MYQTRFRLRLLPIPRWGSLQRSPAGGWLTALPKTLNWILGILLFRGRGGEERIKQKEGMG